MSEKKPWTSAEVAESHEVEPKPKSLETVNLGQRTLGRFQNIKLLANAEQIPANDFEPDFESGNEQLQAQMGLIAEILHSAQQQETAQQRGEWEVDQRILDRAVELSIGYAEKARESNNPGEVQVCLLSGLVIGDSGGDSGEFIRQAVGAGLTNELLDAANIGQNLILNGGSKFIGWGSDFNDWEDPPETPVSVLGNHKELLETVVGRRIEIDGFGLQTHEPLAVGDIDGRLAGLDHEDKAAAALSAEIHQRHPDLQAKAIKDVLSDAGSDYGPRLDNFGRTLIDFAEARPDIFETGLEAEFAQMRQRRLVGYQYRVNDQEARVLDEAVVELWASGRTDLAARMLTASNQEDRVIDRAVGWRFKNNPEQAQVVSGEIVNYVHQQREDLINRIGLYIDGSIAADQTKQDRLGHWLGQLLSEQNLDHSTDPELYFQFVADAAPKLLARSDIDQLGWVVGGLHGAEGPHKLEVAELISNDFLAEVMTDKVIGPSARDQLLGRRMDDSEEDKKIIEILLDPDTKALIGDEEIGPDLQLVMHRYNTETFIAVIESFGRNPNLQEMLKDEAIGSELKCTLRDLPQKLESVANIVGNPKFYDLSQACQIDLDQGSLVTKLTGALRRWPRPLASIDQVTSAFSADPDLPGAIGQLAESQRLQFFLKAVIEPHSVDNISALLADSDALSLLAKNEEERLFDDRTWAAWHPDSVNDNSRALLKAFELVDDLGARGVGELTGRITKTILHSRGQSYLEVAEELESLLADDSVAELFGSVSGEGVLTKSDCLDILLDHNPELRPDAAAGLLAGLKMVDQPAIVSNPSLKSHVRNALLNAPPNKHREIAHRVVSTLEHPRELWKSLYLFSTEIAGIDPGSDEGNIHPISVFPKLRLKLAEAKTDRPIDGVSGFEPVSLTDLSPDNLRALLNNPEPPSDDDLRGVTAIPFNRLRPDAKRQVYAHRLFETVQQTRSAEAKAAADWRNRWLAENRPEIFASGEFYS